MAQQADAQKVFARLEMDKLHKGMVVELDRRLAPNFDQGNASLDQDDGEDTSDIEEALQIVQQTVGTLKNFRAGIEERDNILRDKDAMLAKGDTDRRQLTSDRDALRAELETERGRHDETRAELARLTQECRTVRQERDKLDQQVRQVIKTIKSSFWPPEQ